MTNDSLIEIKRIAQKILSAEMDRLSQYRCDGNVDRAWAILHEVDKALGDASARKDEGAATGTKTPDMCSSNSPANPSRYSAEGLHEDLRQLIRVALTNTGDLIGFIAANYPKEYASAIEANRGKTLPSEIWYPIESAPKDGSIIEIRHEKEGKIYKCRWAASKQFGGDFWWVEGGVGQYDIHGTEWRPTTGAIKPVSVSLEKCARNLYENGYGRKSGGFISWEQFRAIEAPGTHSASHTDSYYENAKAVLEAAGVTYVE